MINGELSPAEELNEAMEELTTMMLEAKANASPRRPIFSLNLGF